MVYLFIVKYIYLPQLNIFKKCFFRQPTTHLLILDKRFSECSTTLIQYMKDILHILAAFRN